MDEPFCEDLCIFAILMWVIPICFVDIPDESLGLKDKYIKSEDGKYSYIIPEWKGDIMAEPCYKTDRKISQYTLMHLLLNPIKYHRNRSRFVNFWTSLFNINYQISTTYKINKYNRQK